MNWRMMLAVGVLSGIALAVLDIVRGVRPLSPPVSFDAGADTGWYREDDGGMAFALNGQSIEFGTGASDWVRYIPGDLAYSFMSDDGEHLFGVLALRDGGNELNRNGFEPEIYLSSPSRVKVWLPDGGLCR